MTIAILDAVAALAFTLAFAMAVVSGNRGLPPRVRPLVVLFLGIWVFVGASDVLEHARITRLFDRYEDFLEILFPALFGFFLLAARSQQEIDQRERAETLLATERDRLAVTVASIADAVVTTDTEGRIIFLSTAAERLLGWSRERAAGQAASLVVPLVDDRTGEPRRHPVEQVLATGRVVEASPHSALVLSDGRMRLVEDGAAPIHDDRGGLQGAVLVLHDVTEKRALQQELLKIQKLESVGVLAGGIAHDFNNILTAIMGNVSLARIYSGATGKAATILDQVETATLRARDLTRQLLTFARGSPPIKLPRDIATLLRDTTTFVLRGTPVRCELDIAEPLAWVDCDEGQLSQVVNNLVLNAKEAMPQGGHVRLSARTVTLGPREVPTLRAGLYVRVSLEDEGVGIAPEALGRIFDPYFTTKERGSGLGLATAFSIVRQHEGYMIAEPGAPRGTRMLVFLPAVERRPAQSSPPHGDARPLRGRILLMDDEPVVRDVASKMLRELGLEVDTVADGTSAIAAYEKAAEGGTPYHAAILDLTVPGGLGGRETMAALRERDPELRAVLASGYSADAVSADFPRQGFDAVLGKPFRLAELREVLRAVLARPPEGGVIAG